MIWQTHVIILKSEQSSPFRRWTTGSGAGSSYRHHDHRNMYNKQMSEGSAPVGSSSGGGGGVARWSLGLEQLLADPAGAAAFAHFLSKEFAAENIRFWWSCEQYSTTEDPAKRAAMAHEIWQRHLAEKASEPVNVDAAARRATALRLYQQPAPQDLFQQAQKQIFNVMKFDSYPRFLRSSVHAECARADLCGLPSPYAPPDIYDQGSPNKQSQLKKSASNASERRRSGGASLLPWKRVPSRDRAQPPAPSPPSPPPQLTDVVKSSQSAGQCSLCRVVLPDGATSVVGVESSTTVRRLVDRLLQRRNLVCATYDVLLKDGESATIDLSSPSTIIGGREVLVERRAVVRVEIAGRSVAVRCRAARRLRHVLRPVLARYAPQQAGTTAIQRLVLRDGCHVHPDTLMQELDGARLQIVDVSESGEYRTPPTNAAVEGRDDDADSLSDLALRPEDSKEFDAQSASSSRTTNGLSGPGLATSLNAGLPTLPTIPPGLAGLPTGLTGLPTGLTGLPAAVNGPGGRVRAALRSGPPLHHHPPDFLENLRETQRQRLQGKEPSNPAPAAPTPSTTAPAAPRAPPPLPPKPPQRAPTVV
ncbi:hypothetical protein ABMA27_007761 [Loxostege sticticalis]|uniref:Regulator of G-protein signaling loco n=1 Tax=Loxostege sticticalis TaxID=481309 RepID=A0ABR3HD38_LOXSC